MLAVPIGLIHYAYWVEPGLIKNGAPAPEVLLRPGLIANFLLPIGLFIVGKIYPILDTLLELYN